MLHGEGEEVAVGFCADAGHPPRVRQQANLTEVGAVAQAGRHISVRHYDIHDSFLNKVHLRPDGALLDDDVPWNYIDEGHFGIDIQDVLRICVVQFISRF